MTDVRAYFSATPPALADKDGVNLQCDAAGNLKIAIAADASSGDTSASGTITANGQAVSITAPGEGCVALRVSGTYSGISLQASGSVDGTNFDVTLPFVDITTSPLLEAFTLTPVANSTVVKHIISGGFKAYQIRSTAFGTGSMAVVLEATPTPPNYGNNFRITDGRSTTAIVTVKDASTAPAAVDASLVVSLSPNSVSAQASLGDAESNPSVSSIGIYHKVWDGSQWRRAKADDGAPATAGGYLTVLARGTFNTTPSTLTNGQSYSLQLTSKGSVLVSLGDLIAGEDQSNNVLRVTAPARADSTDAWTPYATTVLVGTAGQSVKGSAGRVRRFKATNKSTTVAYWGLIVNKATAPVANDLPVWALELPVAAAAGPNTPSPAADFGAEGKYLSTGFAWALSTTSDKVTLAGSSDAMAFGDYA